jgi:hypothetical protein
MMGYDKSKTNKMSAGLKSKGSNSPSGSNDGKSGPPDGGVVMTEDLINSREQGTGRKRVVQEPGGSHGGASDY